MIRSGSSIDSFLHVVHNDVEDLNVNYSNPEEGELGGRSGRCDFDKISK